MNDAADEAQKATSEESEFRKISEEELRGILENHKRWMEAENKTGLDHLRADLVRADLKKADLRGAQLQGADLEEAQLQEARLADAKLQGADLTNADLREANLSNAQLETINGLRAEMLAGAVLTNAKLPGDVARFDQLKHVEETSRNASTVFFGLLAASLYSWLSIASTTDAALITGTASSPLPIINTNIALSGFYFAAPLILIAVYFYFHLYLQRLWRGLASLPAVFPDGGALDDKAYPWLLNGLVRAHFKNLEIVQRPLTKVENLVSILLVWWVVPLTLLAFWLFFLPRHDWWVTTLHVALIAVAAWFGVYSYRLAIRTLRGETATEEWNGGDQPARVYSFAHQIRKMSKELTEMERQQRGDQPFWFRMWRSVLSHLPDGMAAASAGLVIVLVLSVGAWFNPGDNLLNWLGSTLGYETYADLVDGEISTKLPGWDQAQKTDVEMAYVKGADLRGSDLRYALARGAFMVNARLADADLRGARLWKADLRGAVFLKADLTEAQLQGADLTGAEQLTQAQLDQACGHETQLPPELTIEPCWSAPAGRGATWTSPSPSSRLSCIAPVRRGCRALDDPLRAPPDRPQAQKGR